VLLVELERAELDRAVGVADEERAEEEGRQDVERHDALVHADRDHGPRGAVGGGGEVELLAQQAPEVAEVDRDRAELAPARQKPADELALATLGEGGDPVDEAAEVAVG